MFDTKIISSSAEDIEYAAKLINAGEVVGMPTETVYGLAADATNEAAVKKIFEAKGRPQDNPLIVHLADVDMLDEYNGEGERLFEQIRDMSDVEFDRFYAMYKLSAK